MTSTFFDTSSAVHSRSSPQRIPDGLIPPFPTRSPPRPLDRSSSRRFGPWSCNPSPRGQPSSLMQQALSSRVLHFSPPLKYHRGTPAIERSTETARQRRRFGNGVTVVTLDADVAKTFRTRTRSTTRSAPWRRSRIGRSRSRGRGAAPPNVALQQTGESNDCAGYARALI
jgi:hypothetical protein